MGHFGITPEQAHAGSPACRRSASWSSAAGASTWALPNLLLGSLVIVPVWFLIYLFRPPGARTASDGRSLI